MLDDFFSDSVDKLQIIKKGGKKRIEKLFSHCKVVSVRGNEEEACDSEEVNPDRRGWIMPRGLRLPGGL